MKPIHSVRYEVAPGVFIRGDDKESLKQAGIKPYRPYKPKRRKKKK